MIIIPCTKAPPNAYDVLLTAQIGVTCENEEKLNKRLPNHNSSQMLKCPVLLALKSPHSPNAM